MSLPAGFLDDLRNRVSIAQVIGRKVMWDQRKSNQGKGDFWAPCPFHQEKTASFHVDDRKGFYYCFGCHAKGDALTFLRDSENLSFMEAVELLAREAGMTMPARDPEAKARAERRSDLSDVCEAAARFFSRQLNGAGAAAARDYLDRRRMSDATRERFSIGFAPDARQALFTHLTDAGIAPAAIEAAGLCLAPDGGGAPYDRFRGRIMFPIRDARGRCIAFGARAVAEGVQPKYLNSPQTDLFDKSRTLYNLGPARAAMGKGTPLIVAEGYMDVIALVAAGFEGAVAPLGTAITEEQLAMIWRLSDEPVVALDGDTAGLRAGQRLAELALPALTAGKGLRFALLPAGEDPDDVLQRGGAQAMQKLIDNALPMARLLWEREVSGQVFDSPERRSALDQRLRAILGRIQDRNLRDHYAEEFRQLRRSLFASEAGPFRGGPRNKARPRTAALPATRGSLLAAGPDSVEEELREAMILALLFAHPELLARFENDLWRLDPQSQAHRSLASVLLDAARHASPPSRETLQAQAGATLEELLARPHLSHAPQLTSDTDPDRVALCLAEDFAVLAARRAARQEIVEAMRDLDALPDEGLTWRLSQAAAAVEKAGRGASTPTEMSEDREGLSNHLQSLIDAQIWVRKRRSGPS
ncbi:DNA primase [Pararhodobacter sp. SW119]|uniref:DNA primase n=1 Tax=Pararhodobacter sp. SW119 TaxID=2780075 RepID=UPI001AE02E2E|nr:DNA primase [Pararhodobacter sp. SW119]